MSACIGVILSPGHHGSASATSQTWSRVCVQTKLCSSWPPIVREGPAHACASVLVNLLLLLCKATPPTTALAQDPTRGAEKGNGNDGSRVWSMTVAMGTLRQSHSRFESTGDAAASVSRSETASSVARRLAGNESEGRKSGKGRPSGSPSQGQPMRQPDLPRHQLALTAPSAQAGQRQVARAENGSQGVAPHRPSPGASAAVVWCGVFGPEVTGSESPVLCVPCATAETRVRQLLEARERRRAALQSFESLVATLERRHAELAGHGPGNPEQRSALLLSVYRSLQAARRAAAARFENFSAEESALLNELRRLAAEPETRMQRRDDRLRHRLRAEQDRRELRRVQERIRVQMEIQRAVVGVAVEQADRERRQRRSGHREPMSPGERDMREMLRRLREDVRYPRRQRRGPS